jgi:CheY-like chemotaxis protein
MGDRSEALASRPVVVLFVDDYEDTRELAAEALRPAGYKVLLAENGAEAVRVAEAAQPDVIVMDLVMPVMNGVDATRALKASVWSARIPVIAYTANVASLIGVDHMFAEVCLKPCPAKRLVKVIEDVLTRRDFRVKRLREG